MCTENHKFPEYMIMGSIALTVFIFYYKGNISKTA